MHTLLQTALPLMMVLEKYTGSKPSLRLMVVAFAFTTKQALLDKLYLGLMPLKL
jgi:hypothetical protein